MESCSATHQPSLRFDKWSVDAVHFVVKPTGVTQVVAGSISPPEGGRHGPTVDALSSFSKVIEQVWWQKKKIKQFLSLGFFSVLKQPEDMWKLKKKKAF